MANVCVIGGGGGIGQAMCLLLKLNPLVGHLRVFDLVGAPGVAADLSHIDTSAKVTGHGMTLAQMNGNDVLKVKKFSQQEKDAHQAAAAKLALTGCDVVVIPAGVPRKPGMDRQALFAVNAGLIKGFANYIADYCPTATVCVITNPVNSTVPIMAAQLKARNVYNPKKVFGVTSLDLVRARTFVSEAVNLDPSQVYVPVVGGHAGKSILPLLSQSTPPVLSKLSAEQITALTSRIQVAGTEVVNAKAGGGSATLSMAYAGAGFAIAVIKAMFGEKGVVQCAFVESDVQSGCQFFASEVELGPNGAEKIRPLGPMTAFEQSRLNEAVTELKPSIDSGNAFIQSKL